MMPKIYIKKIAHCNFDAIHFYEHLVMTDLLLGIRSRDYIPGLWGHAEAEAFEDLIMLQIGAYDDTVWPVVEEIISQPVVIDEKKLANTIQQVECELGSDFSYDQQELRRQLGILNTGEFVDLDTLDAPELIPSVSRNEPDLFIENTQPSSEWEWVKVTATLSDANLVGQVVFLRLAPIICDTLTQNMLSEGLRIDRVSGPELDEKEKPCCNLWVYTKRPQGEILAAAVKDFDNVRFANSASEVQKYIQSFADATEVAAFFPVDYYRISNILTSRPLIARSFTPENLQRVWEKLTVSVAAD